MNGSPRRELLRLGGGSLAVAGLGGCLDRTVAESDGHLVQASFFTLYDFTRNVAGEHVTVSNPVPAEQHGHGWEPSTNLLPEIVESDAFVYLDAEGFQPWAESAADEIRANYDDVQLINALEGIDLVEYDRDHHNEHDHAPDGYGSVSELELVDGRSRQVIAQFHFGHWHGSVPTLGVDETRRIDPRFIDSDNNVIPLGDNYRIEAAVDDTDTLSVETDDGTISLDGQDMGETALTIELWADDSREFLADPITVTVDDDAEAGPDPDHGLVDVKFFSDPVLAQQGVRNIRDGLVELDPDHESTYREQSADYIEQLDALHQQFRAELADRDRQQVMLAGHDSFQYLGRRYGFEIETPVGLSPNDEPSTQDLADAVAFVEDHEISHVLWDYFDGDRTAEAIVAESETATETAKVSAAESYLPEWKEAGYGDYIGQMREINLPAFKAALGAD